MATVAKSTLPDKRAEFNEGVDDIIQVEVM
jgi:hypothetical protein